MTAVERREFRAEGLSEPISHYPDAVQDFFGEARPASTLVEVSRLAIPGARIEVEAVAIAAS